MPAPDTSIAPATLSPEATVDALRHGSVVRWWQTTAFLEAQGPDCAALLDGLCTQAVERIAPGHAELGLFLDAKAKLIAPAILHRLTDAPWADPRSDGEHSLAVRFLLETLPELVEPLRAHLARYRLRARATIAPIELASIAVVGPSAADAELADAAGAWSTVASQAWPTRAFIGETAACTQLVSELLPAARIQLADPDALEAARIEQGVASLHDLIPGRMPAEIGGMESAVALDAGCYLGQEPVARLHYRGHANRTLRRVVATGPITPTASAADAPDSALALHRAADDDEARAVGQLTTWAQRPDGTSIALAVLRREFGAHAQLRLRGSAALLTVLDEPEA